MVCALAGDEPVFQATNAATDRAPVAPHSESRSISAAISTMRPSIALRCPANSDNSSNKPSSRACRGGEGTNDVAVEGMTPSKQWGPTIWVRRLADADREAQPLRAVRGGAAVGAAGERIRRGGHRLDGDQALARRGEQLRCRITLFERHLDAVAAARQRENGALGHVVEAVVV